MSRLQPAFQEALLEAGCDEAGRGPLAGALFAAAVILPKGFYHPKLNDSKKLSKRDREMLREVIEGSAIAWAVAEVGVDRIDEINILNATFEAMNSAVRALGVRAEFVAIDGNRFKSTLDIPHECVVKGDSKLANIAAASILAKTHRDEKMRELSELYPQYGWAQNSGYPTKKHRAAIAEYGATEHHRKSFRLLADSVDKTSKA